LPVAVSIQNAYNLLNRSYEMGLSEVTRRAGIPLLAYSPLGFGHLSAKYLNGARPAGARLTRFPPFGQRYDKPNVIPAVAAYAERPTRRACRQPLWPWRSCGRWFCASTIIGATTMAQLQEDIDVEGVSLQEGVLAEIDAIHQRHPNPAI
jgi:aryl-alcohol dehydrogenase (NADP+)